MVPSGSLVIDMGIFAERMKLLGTESAFSVGDHIKHCETKGEKVIKLNLGEPDFNSAPNINQAACENIRIGNSHYVDPQGILPLRESIARHVSKKHNVQVSPDQIVVTSGGKPSISYSMLSYVNAGDEVIFPRPGFPIYISWINFLGAVPVPVYLKETRGFRFDAAELKRLISPKTKLIILNSPANPTGAVLTREDLLSMASLIEKTGNPDVRVLSDEVYDEIVFDGQRHESISAMPGMAKRCIVLNSFSKSFAMTGWRLGYAVLPNAKEATVFSRLNINTFSCVPPFIQMAGKAALENDINIEINAAMNRQFEERRNYIVEALNHIEGVQCIKPQGAFYTYPNITGICKRLRAFEAASEISRLRTDVVTPSALFQMFLLYRYGVATLDGNSFGQGGDDNQYYLRISIASKIEELKEGVYRIDLAAKDVDGFQRFISAIKAGKQNV
jgi:aspartate aminotransferase